MNDTKQKILETALRLFNTSGIADVSLRTIAEAMEISVGNLQYHFKKREDIVEALYFQLVAKIDRISSTLSKDIFPSFFEGAIKVFKVLFEYHFFLLDFVTITRRNPKIKLHYSELSKNRELQFFKIVDVFIQKGLFRQEQLQNEYHNLFKRVEVISNFWLSSVLIQTEVLSESVVKEYAQLVSQSIYPYLTEAAKKEYAHIFPTQLMG